ncbi:hypothetical protein S4054249_22705 [Pseudoalteromonas luteoviolacea]|uniref:Uncharacterized protein n=1 Tax=Pseudoalteromonas luteoviolacea S4054 TaxID=1129367 RepID=A0A0F6A7A1_9GAMM|nr:hypothetical protein S4054249_22705 [Pseudoalteromonas luteoviolacea]AOT15259.1 hypothetical protein S40542_20890 [Pseudoalteromonas luteoviolacea]AOT20491.1 hypothetical protein S4054_22620 [Pseudoalteromonas luteoviolacea]KKE82040.1 hypothetical protein N479_20025 [Pseudoalteromonas luteoviolacea S4054]KZN67741.1 hypothetical protein N481_23890 [Pseudoalteromonas luteoviolacea S4047-1]
MGEMTRTRLNTIRDSTNMLANFHRLTSDIRKQQINNKKTTQKCSLAKKGTQSLCFKHHTCTKIFFIQTTHEFTEKKYQRD